MEQASEHDHEHYETIQYAFVDESGNTDLPAPLGDSDFYVICCLLLPAHMLDQAREGADALVRLHAGSGELKSNKIKSNSRRRRRILEDIRKLDIPVYCLVVDKLQVWQDSGLQWKTSFYKFLHRMCYNRIRGSYTGIDVTADQFGNSDFMESFRQYISQRASLFDKFRFQPSNTVPLLQIADVVAGSVRRVWLQEDPIELLTGLGYPSVPIEEWPPLASTATAHPPADADELDQIILRTAVRLAREFVEQHIDEGSDAERLQAEAVRYLLMRLNGDPREYVHRAELASHIREYTGVPMTDQTLSQSILAPVRDAGLLISSTDKGVKIPARVRDLREWIDRATGQIVPYLRRVEKARTTILLESQNKHDIVDPETYPALSRYLGRHE